MRARSASGVVLEPTTPKRGDLLVGTRPQGRFAEWSQRGAVGESEEMELAALLAASGATSGHDGGPLRQNGPATTGVADVVSRVVDVEQTWRQPDRRKDSVLIVYSADA